MNLMDCEKMKSALPEVSAIIVVLVSCLVHPAAAKTTTANISNPAETLTGDIQFTQVEHFVSHDPERLVVDLREVDLGQGRPRHSLPDGFRRLRIGDTKQGSRFVFHAMGDAWPEFELSEQAGRKSAVVASRPQRTSAERGMLARSDNYLPTAASGMEGDASLNPSQYSGPAWQSLVSGRDAGFEPGDPAARLPFSAQSDEAARSGLSAPGSTWGELRYPGSEQPADEDNLIIEGAVEQGIDAHRFGENSALNVFAKINYTFDTEKFDYNRKLRLGAGVKVRHAFSPRAAVAVGVKYQVERRFVDDRTLDGLQWFADWFGTWNVSAGQHNFPGSTWGEIRYPGSQVDEQTDDAILEGSVEQGIDWVNIPRLGVFNTYVVLDYIADTEELDYNNSITFGFGAKFKRRIGPRSFLQYGIELVRDQRWTTGQSKEAAILFLSWSGWWDALAWRTHQPN